jgi:hypothetical protein
MVPLKIMIAVVDLLLVVGAHAVIVNDLLAADHHQMIITIAHMDAAAHQETMDRHHLGGMSRIHTMLEVLPHHHLLLQRLVAMVIPMHEMEIPMLDQEALVDMVMEVPTLLMTSVDTDCVILALTEHPGGWLVR